MAAGEATRNIQAILWDLDGTLVNSEPLHEALERSVLGEYGVELTDALKAVNTGATVRIAMRNILEAAGRPELLDEVVAKRNARAIAEVVDRTVPVRGADTVLREIPMRTHRFGLVTSNDRFLAEATLERFGWTWRFEVVVTADDVTHPKPDPEPYLKGCEGLGLDPPCVLVVEDSPRGVRSARAAGCPTAAVVGTFQASELQEANYVLSNLGAVHGLLSVLS